jgi:hypothetical protein
MRRHSSLQAAAMAVALAAFGIGASAQQRGQAAEGRGGGRGAAEQATRPPLLFREAWKQPPYTGQLTDQARRVTQAAVSNPQLELTLYGPDAKDIEVYEHEGRLDLWSGMTTSPVAVTLKDRDHYLDLTGLARLRWIVRTQSLHTVYPVLKLADGTLVVGSRGVSTDGDYIESEVAFGSMRWYTLDPQRVVTTVEVKSPDLSRVDEIGWADLAPGGGHGNAGWHNVSTLELYAVAVPR